MGEILDFARQMVDPMLRASVYWSQSRVHLSQGDPDRAAEYAQLALATLRASEQTLEAARALLLLAFIENDRGNSGAALELVEEGEPIVTAAKEAEEAAMFTIERARALCGLGEGDEAVALLRGIAPRLASARPPTTRPVQPLPPPPTSSGSKATPPAHWSCTSSRSSKRRSRTDMWPPLWRRWPRSMRSEARPSWPSSSSNARLRRAPALRLREILGLHAKHWAMRPAAPDAVGHIRVRTPPAGRRRARR